MIKSIEDKIINNNIYNLVFERLKPAIFLIDESLNIINANAAARNLSKYESAVIHNLNLNDIFIFMDNGPDFISNINNGVNSNFGINGISNCRALLLKKDGIKIEVDLKIKKILNDKFSITFSSPSAPSASSPYYNYKVANSSGRSDFKFSLRSSIDALPLWIACGDTEGVYSFANKYYDEIFKIPLDKMIGHNFKEIFPPELYLRHKALYDQCVSTGQSVTFEDKNDLITGRDAYVYGIYTPIISENNEICGVSAAIFDNTAKKELEAQIEKTGREIKETEEKYRALIENSICGIAILDMDKIIYTSDTLLKIFGYDNFTEFSSKKITEYYTPETKKFSNEWKTKKICDKKYKAEFEVSIIRKDKSIRTLLINLADITINDKIYTQTAFIDVTYRNETNRKLKEWIDRYECITAASGQIAYEYDIMSDKITWWTSIEKMFGYKPEEIEDTLDSWLKLVHPEDIDKTVKIFKEIETNDCITDNEYRVKHKNGHYVWIWNRGFFRSNGSLLTSKKLGLMEDITELKKIEETLISAKEKAEAAGKAKNIFLANISHEIRTPMNGIIGFTNLMGASGLNDKQKEFNDIIKASCNHLIGIINDILDFSKIESKKMKIEYNIFDINTALNNSIKIISELSELKNNKIETHIDERINYKINGDKLRFKQILINLLMNAVKFTANGKIEVKIEELSLINDISTLLIEVSDTGIGIPSDKISEIFKMFHQLNEPDSAQFESSGVGLSIVKNLVEIMEGSISVKSIVGAGSVFTVKLPFKVINKDDDIIDKKNAADRDDNFLNKNKSYKILLAEDDAISRLLVKAICDKNGWNIFMARNGVELLEIYKKEKFDIILIDGQMPLMDGFEAAAEIRALEQKSGTRIPIIAITACALKEEQQKFIDAGMDDYISKPIESETLFTQKILSYINKEIQ